MYVSKGGIVLGEERVWERQEGNGNEIRKAEGEIETGGKGEGEKIKYLILSNYNKSKMNYNCSLWKCTSIFNYSYRK